MRNGLEIPVSYSQGCVYSIYDMVETQLESYHTHLDSYWEVCNQLNANKTNFQGNNSKSHHQSF
jgi:hypothetical protein